MTWFLQSTDFYLWDIIENGPNIPTKVENVVFVPKPRKELDELDKINSNLSYDDLQDALKNYMRILKKLV